MRAQIASTIQVIQEIRMPVPDLLVDALSPIAPSMAHSEHPASSPRLHVGTTVILQMSKPRLREAC